MLYSFEKKTTNKDIVQLVIGLDDDDQDSLEYSQQYKSDLNVIWNIRGRTIDLNGRLNLMCNAYPADVYWGINDDLEIRTEGWEQYFQDEGPIFYKIRDVHYFPAMSQNLKNALGFFMPPAIYNLGADDALWDIVQTNPKLIREVPVEVWHYKYNHRTPKWFRKTLDRSTYFVRNDTTRRQIEEYKERIRNL